MSLQFVIGRSGSGKSHFVYNSIIQEAVHNPKDRFFVIVPEQFSMQTQKELVKLSPGGSILNTDVLSFNRLAYRVFEETGENRSPVLEDSGKVLVIQKILSEKGNELKILGKLHGKTSAASCLKSLLSEFKQYRIGSGRLNELKNDEKLPALLRYKLEDFELVYNSFNEYLADKYLTAEDVPEILSRVIPKSKMLKDATIVFDGFTGFVPTQLSVIEKMLRICKKVIIVLTGDESVAYSDSVRMSDLFYMSQHCKRQLLEIADRVQVEVLDTIYVEPSDKSRFSANAELDFLEKNLFRYNNLCYEKEPEKILICEAADHKEEIIYAAETILRLVREEGYMFRDFAFVTGALDDYAQSVQNIFQDNNISCFLDRKTSILANTAVEFIRSAVGIAADGFTPLAVFRYLRSGFSNITRQESDLLETYVSAFGVRSIKGYEKEWIKTCRTVSKDDLPKLNDIRIKLLEEIGDFIEKIKKRNSDIKYKTTAVYELMLKVNTAEKCDSYREYFDNQNMPSQAMEYDRIYETIIDYFDKLTEIMGDEKTSVKTYQQILDAGFSDHMIGIVPPALDQVTIGDIERTRLTDVKILFVAGVNEGTIPKQFSRISLLSASERNALAERKVRLAPEPDEEMYRQRLYLYLNLTKPSDRLYISYRRSDNSGSPVLPSYIIRILRELFKKSKVQKISNMSLYNRLETFEGVSDLVLKGVNNRLSLEEEECYQSVLKWLNKNRKGRELISRMKKGIIAGRPDTDIGLKAAEILYNENKRYSASRLELFAGCPFAHFLLYGLKIKEKDEYEISSADIGSILHDAIKRFCEEISGMDPEKLSADERDALADAALEKSIKEDSALSTSGGEFSGVDIYIAEQLKRLNKANAWAVYEQLKRGSFKLFKLEMPYYKADVSGIIDRIDICEKEDTAYIRIIDYKSGKTEISLRDFYYGLQLQLPVYLIAALAFTKQKTKKTAVEPAGIYYCNISDPFIKVESFDEETDEDAVLSALKLSGYSREEPEILKLLDHDIENTLKSAIIPVKLKKDGTVDSRSRVLENTDFYLIEKYAGKIIESLKKRIEKGEAKINPLTGKDHDSCQYCPYGSICRYDENIKGYKKDYIPSVSDKEVLRKISMEDCAKEEP